MGQHCSGKHSIFRVKVELIPGQAWVDELRLESSFKCQTPAYDCEDRFDWQTHFFCGCCKPVAELPWYLILMLVTTTLSYVVYETNCTVSIDEIRRASLKVCWENKHKPGMRFKTCLRLLKQLFKALELEQKFTRQGPSYDGPLEVIFSFDADSNPSYLYQFCVEIPQADDIVHDSHGQHQIYSEVLPLIM
jgi:hypothetical protein